MSEPVDTSAEAVRVVAVEEEARIESALRYDDSEYQLAFQEGYLRAMTIAERRWTKERAEQETLLAERNRQNAAAFGECDRLRDEVKRLHDVLAPLLGDPECPHDRIHYQHGGRFNGRPYTACGDCGADLTLLAAMGAREGK